MPVTVKKIVADPKPVAFVAGDIVQRSDGVLYLITEGARWVLLDTPYQSNIQGTVFPPGPTHEGGDIVGGRLTILGNLRTSDVEITIR